MTTIPEEKLIQKANNEIDKYKLFKDFFSNIYDEENTLSEKRKKALKTISEIKETDNEILRSIYMDFNRQMSELERQRNMQLSVISDKLIPTCQSYPNKANNAKKNIGFYQNIKKTKEKQESDAIKAKSNNDADVSSKLSREANNNQKLLIQKGQDIKSDLLIYEAERVRDNKLLYLHFVHSELNYHAKAVEVLSQLYSSIFDSEPIEGLKNFAQSYEIKSVDLADFGYDEKKIQKKKRKAEKRKEKEENKGEIGNDKGPKKDIFNTDEIA